MNATTTYPHEILDVLGGRPPTEEQWRAITWPLEPYVLVAGAGSGKTSVMAARVVYLALVALGRLPSDHPGVLPGNVLCLTFTNKATENLQRRVRRALAGLDLPDGEEPEITNYHGFAAQLLERHGVLIGIEPNQRVLTPAQRVELCARVLDRMTFEVVEAQRLPGVVDRILTLDDQAANHFRSPDEIVAFNEQRLEELKDHRSDRAFGSARERIELARACAVFRELKRELGVIDFGDQIELALNIVEQHPEVSRQYRERFAAVLLDEYQDTNVAQARLMAGVFGDGHPVTAVGDPDQNIYAWRGASLFNLLEFPNQFRKADGDQATKLPLYTNFRSGARILEAADILIGQLPAQQRPDPDKRLVPWEENGPGEVHVARISDEVKEAAWVADRIVALHEHGAAWSDCAVLCRTSRLFLSLQQAFNERGVPAEILGLAGLLKMPEVVEVLAYARATLDPLASVALGRILLGPRYRVGFKDLALVASLAKNKSYALREEDETEGEATPFLFTEALEHLDEVEGISEEGWARLEECRQELAALRVEARRPVGEFLGEIIRRTGILTELDAQLDVASAATARRNLAAFLDEVHAFSPVQGELTLRAFLEYVDTVENLDKQEWSPVQPSEEDSVKVMTIHVAKGLEFDHVFVPGLANGLLPNTTIQHNPAERGKSMDFELRGDASYLPRYDGNLSAFKKDLKKQEEYEERRTAYVAMTRARRTLHVTGAHWYAENLRAKEAGPFLRELKDWVMETKHATWDPGADIDEENNPILGYRERFVRNWPGPALPAGTDALFPEGWRHAAVVASDDGSVQASLLESLDEKEREALVRLTIDRRGLALHLKEREGAEGAGQVLAPPQSVSVGGVIDYSRCPKRFYWTSVRPLPRFSGPAARIGTEIHSWIERRSSGQGQLLELDDAPDLTSEELADQPSKVDRLRQAFLASRFAGKVPLFAERAFLLRMEGFAVSGRIDAVFGESVEAPWEIVDWKTGKRPAADDPLAGLQLELYGLACIEVWGKRAEDLTLTYLYLAGAEEVSHPMGDPEEVRARVSESLRAIGAGAFDPIPGAWCHHCDFLSFCEAGRARTAREA
ncbi:MAG TPA: ATP-dependent DNA helicase [Actinomycetota bacterium]|nr:ATP-dependent DNA helicase [Actinomycetota bacterium]